jgi:protein-S-isoprenylcysteine O-methyltransferase Ste14
MKRRLTPGRLMIVTTRVWLPLAIAVAGVVLIVLGHGSLSTQSSSRALQSGIGVGLLIIALIVWMINWMFRLSMESTEDRAVEERARDHFDRTGRWPDEEPP